MRHRWLRATLAAPALWAALACTDKPPSPVEPPPAAVSFGRDIEPLFARYGCTGCHGSPGNSGYSVLTYESVFGPGSQAASRGMFEVVAGQPGSSYLLWKLEGRGPAGEPITGQRMPRSAPPMDSNDVAAIRAWIREGARDN